MVTTRKRTIVRVRRKPRGGTVTRFKTPRPAGSGGGVTIVDPKSGATANVNEKTGQISVTTRQGRTVLLSASPSNVRQFLTATRQKVRAEAITSKQAFQTNVLKKQGFRVSKDKEGNLIGEKGSRKVVITKRGDTVNVPRQAIVSSRLLANVRRQQERTRQRDILLSGIQKRTKKVVERQGATTSVTAAGDLIVRKGTKKTIVNAAGGSITIGRRTPTRKDKKGNIIAVEKGKQIVLTKRGKIVKAPLSAKVRPESIPTARTKQLARELKEKRKTFKRFAKAFAELPVSFVKGLRNIIDASALTAKQAGDAYELVLGTVELKATADALKAKAKKGKKIRGRQLKVLQRKLINFRAEVKRLKRADKRNKKLGKILDNQDTKLAAILILIGTTANIIGITAPATVGKGTAVTLGVAEKIIVLAQSVQTAKNPTPENFGRLTFFALPTALNILTKIRKLSPRFRPNVKNVRVMKKTFLKKIQDNKDLLKLARGGKTLFLGRKQLTKKQAVSFLLKQNKGLRQGLKELNWILKNPEIIKTGDFNPIVHTRNFKKLQNSYVTGVHVSTQPKVGKLFGQTIKEGPKTGLPTREVIFRRVLTKAGKIRQPKKIGNLSNKTLFDKLVLRIFKTNKVIIGGGKALNLQVSLLRRRFTSDLDAKVAKGARKILETIARRANTFELRNRYTVKQSGHKGTFKLIDKAKGKTIIELTNVKNIGKVKYALNPQGLRIEKKVSLIFGKADSLSKAQRFTRKGKLDIADVTRLTGGKVRARDILVKTKNPSKVFQVVRQPQGMGKGRIGFDETHMYWDFDAGVAYSKGKLYSIIKFPSSRISKFFPPNLRRGVARAAAGQLNTQQSNALRKALNAFIKQNINKFFLGPRTASLPIGEREWVLAEGSKFVRGQVYKTFDNDLRKFINVIEVGFRKPRKLSLFKQFINGWKRKPFTTLRLRLSNPDVLLVRKYSRLVERDLTFTKADKNKFIRILHKMFKSKKAQLALKKEAKKKKEPKLTTKEKKLREEILELRRRFRTEGNKRIKVRIKNRIFQLTKRLKLIIAREKRKPSRGKRVREATRKPTRRKPTKRIRARPTPPRPPPPKRRPKPTPRRPPTPRITRTPRIRTRIPTRTRPRPRPRKPEPIKRIKVPPPPKIEKNKVKEKKLLKAIIQKRKFVFTPDLVAILFGQFATPELKKKLTQKGRVFSGLERRFLIKGVRTPRVRKKIIARLKRISKKKKR